MSTDVIERTGRFAGRGRTGTSRAAARLAGAAATAMLALLAAGVLAVGAAATAGVAPHVELSDSMRPALRAGDVVWVDRIPAHRAGAGDVVAFDHAGRDATVLHRVEHVRRAPHGRLAFTTRGDANDTAERWSIAADGVVGRYVGVRVPAAGRVVHALHGRALTIVALASALLLAALGLRRIWG